MGKLIEFIDTVGNTPGVFHPVPAISEIPEWYKKTQPYSGEKIVDQRFHKRDLTNGTIKKCRPVWDALISGYIIKSTYDINVRFDENGQWFEWRGVDSILFHPMKQAENYPGQANRNQDFPKFNHPWMIKTPKGYSSLFTTPFHRELPFHTFEGVVDTDVYHGVVTLPFLLKSKEWEGLIPAGTPIAQVTPIKRDNWLMSIRDATESDIRDKDRSDKTVTSVFNDGYKKFFWNRKEYR